jgi:hypothetical protein
MNKISARTFTLVFSATFLLSSLSAIAKTNNPNNRNLPEPGWSLWRPQAEVSKADFDAGFSNIELGGYLEFENACATKSGLPQEKIQYWFRLSNSVNRIGTGTVEYGCWLKGRFLATHSSTAIKSSLTTVQCLQVNSPTGNGLIIRAEPTIKSKQIGIVANKQKVKVESFPVSIVEADGRNWVSISAPRKGWISDGSFASKGNLRLCRK